YRLANIYEKSGMMEKAIECFNEAVRRNPKDFASWLQLAHANLDRGEFLQALEQYKKVLTFCWDDSVLSDDERFRIIEEALESILEISEKTGKSPQLPLPSRLREQGESPPKIICDLANEWGMDFAFALYVDGEVDPDQCRVEETESGTIIRVRIPKDRAIPKNRPCPCGSGKVYKKCCGAE
ncbi:MAG: tetratricopeptide repeat protein, partial [Planctomycetaceae bacterium]|nr:tetratricopeptide repeat protein [Planctomycetaceae bacterium]